MIFFSMKHEGMSKTKFNLDSTPKGPCGGSGLLLVLICSNYKPFGRYKRRNSEKKLELKKRHLHPSELTGEGEQYIVDLGLPRRRLL